MPERHLPYGRQSVDSDDIDAVGQTLASDFLTTGPEVTAFEAELVAACGATHAAVVNSGTSALHAAYAAIGIGEGDEVIVPALTFAATANAALYLRARPVFVDVDPRTGLILPEHAAEAITARTKAVVGVDYAGQPADYDSLRRIAESRGVAVIADAAHSLGATDAGRPVGTLADATVLSFHPVKVITTGEGGAVLTDSEDVHSQVLQFRSHGMVTDRSRTKRDDGPWYMEMQTLGFNYRMTDLQCALGRSQLRRLQAFVARRRRIADTYDAGFSGTQGLETPTRRIGVEAAWHLYVVRVREASRRRRFFDALRDAGLGVQVHYIPVYRHPYYERLGYTEGLCPNAEEFYERAISLPMYPGLEDGEVARVVDVVATVAREVLG